jgi:four helix bundle protein
MVSLRPCRRVPAGAILVKANPIRDQSYAFALKIVALYRELSADREFVLANQLLRSGTSIGANVEEALAGQSRRDFASKMAIASKEARECHYWLRLLGESGLVAGERISLLIADCDGLVRMLTSIVKTSRPTDDRSKTR